MKKLKIFSIILAYLSLVALGLVFVSCEELISTVSETTYTVSFDANGGNGTVPNPITINAGSSITLPNVNGLSKTSFTFGGWNTNALSTGTDYPAGSLFTPTDNTILFAKWEIVMGTVSPDRVSPDRIEYYWVDQHGSLVTTSSGEVHIAPGATLTITAQGDGYVVKQWRLNGKNTGQNGNIYNFSSTTAGIYTVGLFVEKDGKLYNTNITIIVGVFYTVTFNANGGNGTVPVTQTVTVGSSIILPSGSGLIRSGYTFGSWNTNASGTGTTYNAGSSYTPTGNVTLYAKWNSGGPTGTEANPISLTASTWANGSITSTTSGNAVWYSFNITNGTTYYVWWNDTDVSQGKTLDVKVSAYYSSGTSIFINADSGWSSPRSFTANTNGIVKIKVEPYYSGSTGTFAIAYRTNSTRP